MTITAGDRADLEHARQVLTTLGVQHSRVCFVEDDGRTVGYVDADGQARIAHLMFANRKVHLDYVELGWPV